ncbi:MAG: HAMP domain-containing protein [Rhodocyclaceae bacterium]|nr:HAMP domain-containing protein [Rhodocyclaceae bacterium]
MFRQRLFWKLFLSFWVALLLFAVGVLYAASAYLDATRERYDQQNPRERNEYVFGSAQAAANGGLGALREWANRVDDSELVPVLVMDAQEKDILGREPSERALSRLAYVTRNYARSKTENGDRPEKRFPVVLPDGHEFWLIPDFQKATLGRLISRPRVVAAQLILATLIGAAVCLALAAYLTAPLRRLREATVAYGSGDFSYRVMPTLGRRSDEIVDLAQSLDTMAERIDALIASQRGLLRDVSHELRSPLARVQVALGLARQRVGNQADGELKRIETEMERLNELIGRIIDFSRLDAGLNPIRHDALRLEQIVADVAADARIEAAAKQCTIVTHLPQQAPFSGDAALLASAVENIVRNALRHSPVGGEIALSLTREPGHWQIAIADQGPGIPEALQARVFEPFFRVDDHRNPQGGIGLGLAIARQAVVAHGGAIELNNRSAGGLQVTISLPEQNLPEKAS